MCPVSSLSLCSQTSANTESTILKPGFSAKNIITLLQSAKSRETLLAQECQEINKMLYNLRIASGGSHHQCFARTCDGDWLSVKIMPGNITIRWRSSTCTLTPASPFYDEILHVAIACEWADENAPGENRREALQRLRACICYNPEHLALLDLSLTTLPPLPSTLKVLDLWDNKLTTLSVLPANLTMLDISGNQFSNLPCLPKNLAILRAGGNLITALPKLPLSLTELYISHNQIADLPNLPCGLKVLHATHNRFSTISCLPSGLLSLKLNWSSVRQLPYLPGGLSHLDIKEDKGNDDHHVLNKHVLKQLARSFSLAGESSMLSIRSHWRIAPPGTKDALMSSLQSLIETRQLSQEDKDNVKSLITSLHLVSGDHRFSARLHDNSSLYIDVTQDGKIMLLWGDYAYKLEPAHPLYETIKILTSWHTWVFSPGESASKNKAYCRLKNCLISEEGKLNMALTALSNDSPKSQKLTSLDLSNLFLSTLPSLPRGLTRLNISNNKIIQLSQLPEGITHLDASGNRLIELSGLPTNLIHLDVSSNMLVKLPYLPATLIFLDARCNRLVNLPPLPEGISTLLISDNRLSMLPYLPDTLNILNANNNCLTKLPCIPITVKCLKVGYNFISSLPSLPDNLTYLNARNNNLISLQNLPAKLSSLDLRHNRLHNLPNLPRTLIWLDISDNYISTVPERPAAATLWRVTPNSPSAIQHVISADQTATIANTIGNIIAGCFSEEKSEWLVSAWTQLTNNNRLQDFILFLKSLTKSKAAEEPAFRQKIAKWLLTLAMDKKLRDTMLLMAKDASSLSEDRACMGWNSMQMVCMLYNIKHVNPKEFLTIARQCFKFAELDKIAVEKSSKYSIQSIQIAVYLNLVVKLKLPLGLPEDFVSTMRNESMSRLSLSDIEEAEVKIKKLEKDNFYNWFIQWSVCQEYLMNHLTESERNAITFKIVSTSGMQDKILRTKDTEKEKENDLTRLKVDKEIFGPILINVFGEIDDEDNLLYLTEK